MARNVGRRYLLSLPGSWLPLVLVLLLGSDGASWAAGGELIPGGDEGPGKRATGTRRREADAAAVEFFEKSVRPILATRCQGCHGPAKQKGGLRLDSRAPILAGGATGPAVVPGNPEESLLVDAINYGETYQMPPKSKLPAERDRHLDRVGRDEAHPGASRPGRAVESQSRQGRRRFRSHVSQEDFQERARYWSFQPLRRVAPPAVERRHAGLGAQPDRPVHPGGPRAARARRRPPRPIKRTLIRRLSFDLTGLPPTPGEVAAFLADPSPGAYERLVDRLLASPHYGERWARHWLDLVRYAETAGHEFDYDIPNAFRYRDYVIRAFNADLPYDQFVVEHIAGDLLDEPRRHPAEGFNESILGTGFYFLGEGTHSPVDVREEEMRRIDNQIDVLSKTFLGLTVACARCHDHKFDPITNKRLLRPGRASCTARGISRPSSIRPSGSARRVRRLREVKEAIAACCATPRTAARTAPRPGRGIAATSGPDDRGDAADAAVAERRAESSSRISTATASTAGTSRATRSANGPAVAGDFRLDLDGRSPRLVASRARPGAQRPGLGPAPGRAPLADLHDRDRVTSTTWSRAGADGSTSSSTASRRSATRSTAA